MKIDRRALNRSVIQLGLVSLFADISSEMLYPITPIFLTTVLGASMFHVGLIEGIAEVLASGLKGTSGVWSDRIQSRKHFVWLGYLLTALAKPLIGFSNSWPQVLSARSIDRIGKGIRTAPRDALLSDSVPADLQGAAFGWHRAMDSLGAAIGPILAIIYLKYHSDLRNIFFWAFIPGLIAVALVFGVKEKPIENKLKRPLVKFSFKDFSKDFKFYLVSWTIFSIANSSDVFLLLKVKSLGISLETTILMYCFYNLTYALLSPYLGILSDRLPRKWILCLGLVIFALTYLGFAVATHVVLIWFLFGIYGIYMAATDGVGKAFAIDLLEPNQKATGLGVLGSFTGLASLIASVSAGYLWDHFGSSYTFYFAALAASLSAILIFFARDQRRV
jgi:MFS family permease